MKNIVPNNTILADPITDCYTKSYMSTRFFLHIGFLATSSLLAYFWVISPLLSQYTLQLVAVLIILYLVVSFAHRHHQTTQHTTITLELSLLTITILLLVSETGGLSSPLFFTLYFLMFAVALFFETEATLVLTATLVIFLALLPTTNLANLTHLAELAALIMITPLAIFTSHEHEKLVLSRKTKLRLIKSISREETDILLFLSLNLKHTLTSALDKLSQLIPQAKTKDIRDSLMSLYKNLKLLNKTAEELSVIVDKETDK